MECHYLYLLFGFLFVFSLIIGSTCLIDFYFFGGFRFKLLRQRCVVVYLLEQHVYVLRLHLRMLALPLCGYWLILYMFGFVPSIVLWLDVMIVMIWSREVGLCHSLSPTSKASVANAFELRPRFFETYYHISWSLAKEIVFFSKLQLLWILKQDGKPPVMGMTYYRRNWCFSHHIAGVKSLWCENLFSQVVWYLFYPPNRNVRTKVVLLWKSSVRISRESIKNRL